MTVREVIKEKYIDFTLDGKRRNIHLDDGQEINEQYIQEINNIPTSENIILNINIEQARTLKSKLRDKINVQLVIKNTSELSVKELEQLQSELNIKYVSFRDEEQGLARIQQIPYNVDSYKRCRDAIDKLLEDVDFEKYENNPNREKYIFGEVIKKLTIIGYDHLCVHQEDELKRNPNKFTLKEKTDIERRTIISRNLEGGLLGNRLSVCAGYAEIVRNVFACCGIETRYLIGFERDKSGKIIEGHVWNKIKLDGKWYNIDVTNSINDIIEEKEPQYLLKSDNDFEISKKFKDLYYEHKEVCSESVSKEDMLRYLYNKEIEQEVATEDTQYYVPEHIEETTIENTLGNVLEQKRKWLLKMTADVREQQIYQSYETLIATKDRREDEISYE